MFNMPLLMLIKLNAIYILRDIRRGSCKPLKYQTWTIHRHQRRTWVLLSLKTFGHAKTVNTSEIYHKVTVNDQKGCRLWLSSILKVKELFFCDLLSQMPQQTDYTEKQYCLCMGNEHLSKAVPGLLFVNGSGWVKKRRKFGFLLHPLSSKWLICAVQVLEIYFVY